VPYPQDKYRRKKSNIELEAEDDIMKIKIAVALGVLFALVPMAAPKGRTPSSSFFASCDSTDTCTVTGSGLAASTSYMLTVTDSCNVEVHSTSVNTNSSGVLNTILGGVAESGGCIRPGLSEGAHRWLPSLIQSWSTGIQLAESMELAEGVEPPTL
jgi:hypothetical protein